MVNNLVGTVSNLVKTKNESRIYQGRVSYSVPQYKASLFRGIRIKQSLNVLLCISLDGLYFEPLWRGSLLFRRRQNLGNGTERHCCRKLD